MRNIIAIHMEEGCNSLEHIALLRWIETSEAGERGGGTLMETKRQVMHDWVDAHEDQAYAISLNDDKYAFLEAEDNGHVQYVKTKPDSTKSDNLLSLPRF